MAENLLKYKSLQLKIHKTRGEETPSYIVHLTMKNRAFQIPTHDSHF